ncbi:hypothetical protein OCU04_007170 [Sclerotinia nivalis]|uniref:Uncharacterized protein n=1 Tax=Sclerotinia nivalis TaxID=352851 RepID=A0A9X0DIK4_9HELO|nr:hypothetical protein OCU04_007170 [Sclerotinia nivalis]
MSSRSGESSPRGESSQSQCLPDGDGKKPSGSPKNDTHSHALDNSNVGTKPSSKSKRGTWRKALGLGEKVEMTEEEKKEKEEITSEIKKIQNEIREIKDHYKKNQKQNSIQRRQKIRDYREEKKETSAEKEERRLKHLRTDGPYTRDRNIHHDMWSMEQRWKEDDEIAEAERDDRLRRLNLKEQDLHSMLKERKRLRHEEPKAKNEISAKERERLQRQELRKEDEISIEEAKNRLRQPTPPVIFQQPTYVKERKPSSSPAELKLQMMMEWDNESCKEWIYDHLEDYLDTYEIGQVKDDLEQMQEICGPRMFKATEGEWEDWLYGAGRVMYWKLQSIVTAARE